jgi:hypothetical protein
MKADDDEMAEALLEVKMPEEETKVLAQKEDIDTTPNEQSIIALDVSPLLKDVDIEEFAIYSSKVLARKLQMHPLDLALPLTKNEAIKLFKELFTSSNLVIIPLNTLIEQLPGLKIVVDVESMVEGLLLPEMSDLDELEARLLNYMEENSSLRLVAVDLNNELQLYKLPQTNDPNKAFKETLIPNIEMYERLLEKQRANEQDTSNTEQLLKTLRMQLAALNKVQTKQATPNKYKAINKDQRIKALNEIFHFYTKQLALAHVRKTFEAVQKERDTMTLGYYVRFLKDFGVEFGLKVKSKYDQ